MIVINMLKGKTMHKNVEVVFIFYSISILNLAFNKDIELWDDLCQGHTHGMLDS